MDSKKQPDFAKWSISPLSLALGNSLRSLVSEKAANVIKLKANSGEAKFSQMTAVCLG